MPTYIVQGLEGADVDIIGTIFKAGDSVELQEDVAAPLLEAGTIAAEETVQAADVTVEADPAEPQVEAPVEPQVEAPVEVPVQQDGPDTPADGETVPIDAK